MRGEDSHASSTDQIFNKITKEKFPKLRKDIPIVMQVQQIQHQVDKGRK